MIELNTTDGERAAYFDDNGASEKRGIWQRIGRWDKWLVALVAGSILLALAALFALLTPILNAIFGLMGLHYMVWDGWVAWAKVLDRGLLVAAALGVTALLVALLARHRALRDYSFYVEAGCPQCHENELIRVQRHSRDRLLGYFGVPVRRYSCRNCTWHGLRFSGYRYPRPSQTPEPAETEPLLTEQVEGVDDWDSVELTVEEQPLDLHTDDAALVAVDADDSLEDMDVKGDHSNEAEVVQDLDYDGSQNSLVKTVPESRQEVADMETRAIEPEAPVLEVERVDDEALKGPAAVLSAGAEPGAHDPAPAGDETGEDAAPLIDGEEFERLCQEVALSKK